MAAGDISSELLSGSSNGRGIAVAATSTPGTTIHTAIAGTDFIDRITLYAANRDTTATTLTVEWGGTSNSDLIIVTLPGTSEVFKVCEDFPLRNALVVRAFSDVASAVNIFGFVHREQVT
jgi:hypothetical protein